MHLKGVIAECGNFHCGSVETAFEMIKAAQDSGAAAVKFQAIEPEVAARHGTMPYAFYEKCALDVSEYIELWSYGTELGIPVFFSVFAGTQKQSLSSLRNLKPFKISGKQFNDLSPNDLAVLNNESTIVSIPQVADAVLEGKKACISNMQKLFVTPYLENNISWATLVKYRTMLGEVGLSDHSVGIDNCLHAIRNYGVKLIEKHFTLGNTVTFGEYTYRDCYHAATPSQFGTICRVFEDYL
jgi:N-acetylneuraminate synthase